MNGAPGAVWAPGGQPRIAFGFTVIGGKIVAIDLLADPAVLGELDLALLSSREPRRSGPPAPCRSANSGSTTR